MIWWYDDDDDDGKGGRFHIARQPPTAANPNIQSSISLSIDIVLKFEYPIFAVYIEDIHHNEINSISDLFFVPFDHQFNASITDHVHYREMVDLYLILIVCFSPLRNKKILENN